MSNVGHRQTPETKALGKWLHESNLDSFLKTLVAPPPKPVDTAKPIIVIDKELVRYFHY